MRRYELTRKYHAAFSSLGPTERAAASAVVAELMDDHVPLVRPDDFSVSHGSAIVGRLVPRTDLVLCYVPAGDEVFVVNIIRRAR